jgi:hypothetical protein
MKTGNDEFIEKVLENLMEKIIGTVKTELVTILLNTSSSSITWGKNKLECLYLNRYSKEKYSCLFGLYIS